MSTPDIVCRLRESVRACRALDRSELLAEAADEIERLRDAIRRLAEQDATLSVCDGAVTVTMDATLTDAEREAIERAVDSQQARAAEMHSRSWTAAAIDQDCDTLRGMLGRQAEGER
jgi:hypothetical protein